MIDLLKPIGVEEGKILNPDRKMQELLNEAAREAHGWIDARYETAFSPPYYEGSQWAVPISSEVIEGQATLFAKPDGYPVDGRGVTYSFGFIGIKHLGTGQFYLMTIKESGSRSFESGS